MVANSFCGKKFSRIFKINGGTFGEKLDQRLCKIHIECCTLRCGKRRRQHIGTDECISAFGQNGIFIVSAVPHLAFGKIVNRVSIEGGGSNHQHGRIRPILKFRPILRGGKLRYSSIGIVRKTLGISQALLHHRFHLLPNRHCYRRFKQELYNKNAADFFFFG